MKIFKFLIYLTMLSLFTLGCSAQKDINKPIKVIVNSDNLTLNPKRLTLNYRTSGNPCDYTWHTVSLKDNKGWAIKLKINKDYNCKSFEAEESKHKAILAKIFTDNDVKLLKSIQLPPLAHLQPNLLWNKKLSVQSVNNTSWSDYVLNYPDNLNGKNSNSILKEVVTAHNIDHQIKKLFEPHGLKLKLSSVEKVLSKKKGTTYFNKLNIKETTLPRVLYDASSFWYEPKLAKFDF